MASLLGPVSKEGSESTRTEPVSVDVPASQLLAGPQLPESLSGESPAAGAHVLNSLIAYSPTATARYQDLACCERWLVAVALSAPLQACLLYHRRICKLEGYLTAQYKK